METVDLSKTNAAKCEFCGEAERGNIHIYTCDMCSKDVCVECSASVYANGSGTLYLCYDCAKLDFTEYKKLCDEVEELSTKIKVIHRRAHDVLVRLHRNDINNKSNTKAIINEDKSEADVSLVPSPRSW
jgi:hypothetical protein